MPYGNGLGHSRLADPHTEGLGWSSLCPNQSQEGTKVSFHLCRPLPPHGKGGSIHLLPSPLACFSFYLCACPELDPSYEAHRRGDLRRSGVPLRL